MHGNKILLAVLGAVHVACAVNAGVGGLVVKGLSHTWDDAARVAAKAGGRSLVKGAEQMALKAGTGVVRLGTATPELIARGTALAERSGCANAGRAVKVLADLPAEDVPRVVGALERNPGVAKEFLDALARGGKGFVDRIFKVNHRQILAGTLGAGAILAVSRGADIVETLPPVVDGRNLRDEHAAAMEILGAAEAETVRRDFADRVVGRTQRRADWQVCGWFGLGGLAVLLLGLLAWARRRSTAAPGETGAAAGRS